LSIVATSAPAVPLPTATARRNENGIVLLWLAIWAISVGTFAVAQWWVVTFCAVSFWFLTWRVSHFERAALVFLRPVGFGICALSASVGAALFLLFFAFIQRAHLHVEGHVPLTLAIWSIFISPVNEELVFRGLLYRGFQTIGSSLTKSQASEVFVIVATGILFGLAHARESVFLLMTVTAGIVYGTVRWRSGSVQASICCHTAYNALALSLLSR
jgi:membrane protease YdiL (CAAX protease family)